MNILEKLESLEQKYNEINEQLNDPAVYNNSEMVTQLSKQRAELQEIVDVIKEYRKVLQSIEDDKEILESGEEELKELAKLELEELEEKKEELEQQLKILLLPKDPNDDKNIILEIRAGTGGEEAALFAGDLFRMYSRYAERKKWKFEILDANPTDLGGFKEVICSINGDKVYSRLKYESGVHRVQRIPTTESGGRIHTSAASVAVLPEAEEIDIEIKQEDLRIDVYRATGHGGQHVNTTDSAVRITHIPTGIVVQCQDEKSQLKNKLKAMKVLRARLYDKYQKEQQEKIAQERKSMVSTGDRSVKIRTYNFPQKRVTDHRINLTLYKLDEILDGNIDELIDALIVADQTEKLKDLQ